MQSVCSHSSRWFGPPTACGIQLRSARRVWSSGSKLSRLASWQSQHSPRSRVSLRAHRKAAHKPPLRSVCVRPQWWTASAGTMEHVRAPRMDSMETQHCGQDQRRQPTPRLGAICGHCLPHACALAWAQDATKGRACGGGLYPKSRKLRAAYCVLCFTSGNGAMLGGLDTPGVGP